MDHDCERERKHLGEVSVNVNDVNQREEGKFRQRRKVEHGSLLGNETLIVRFLCDDQELEVRLVKSPTSIVDATNAGD